MLTTVIEADGSTGLVQAGTGYVLASSGGSSGPELKLSGAAVTPGQLGGWLPIGAEAVGGGAGGPGGECRGRHTAT